GSRVLALDLDGGAAADLAGELPGDGHAGAAIDVTDRDSCAAAAGPAGGAAGEPPCTAVVYAAGIAVTADVAVHDPDDWRRTLAVNLDGAFHVGQAFVRPMLAAGTPGAFVYLSSVAGRRGEAGAAAYCASKFGLIGLVESFAAELTEAGIRVNAVCPGNVDSPLLRAVSQDIAAREDRDAEAVYAEHARIGAARRLVDPAEVASACLWLCSSGASGVTGTTLTVDVGAMIG
ncbi:MAG: SDR family oxidoreductase, partial [Azospirillaceae bacterium]